MFDMSSRVSPLREAVIRRLAGPLSYQRGVEYYRDGHVVTLEEKDHGIRAIVHGTHNYAVELTLGGGTFGFTCDCPHAGEGAFCKHCVAAALAWLRGIAEPVSPKSRRKTKELTPADIEKILNAEDQRVLVRMVLDWAKDDDRLHERILLFAARRAGPEAAIVAAHQTFRKAAHLGEFVDYEDAESWAQGVDGAIDNIAQLLDDGQAPAVIELCESALADLDAAADDVEDSDGHLVMLQERLQDVHFRACQQAKPGPVDLARRLFEFELHSELDVFSGACERYSGILGSAGLAEYRRLAEAEWAKVPARTSTRGQSDSERHSRITSVMESLARASGDVEALVAVLSKDLSSAYGYLRIAEVYREAHQYDQALLWAEKGLSAFPERVDPRLRELAAEEYHRQHRHHEAMKLIWPTFLARPVLDTYRTLERHAGKALAWPQWRDRALSEIRARIAKARQASKRNARPLWMRPNDDHSQLVEIFLYEGDGDAAWHEAQEGGCSDPLWLRLAEVREKLHPEDAVPIYLNLAEHAVTRVRNSRYDEPVDLLVKAAAAMKSMDRAEDFVRHLESLRQKFKAKRNFIKLLDERRKSLYLR